MKRANTHQDLSLPKAIQNALDLDLRESRQLLQLLQDEQTAMQTRDRERLADVVKAKTDCMNRIEQQANARYQLLTANGRTVDEAEWKSLVESQRDPHIQKTWQDLLTTVEECRHSNEVSGRLINRGQQTMHYLLSVIRGQLNPPTLYNQRGAAESHQDGHSVTRA